jgi:hypothetical protein
LGRIYILFRRGGNFPLGGFSVGREVSGGLNFRENFTLGKFTRIPLQNSFCVSFFLFVDSFLHVWMLMVIVRDKFSPGLNCLEDLSVEGEPNFPELFKK